MRLLSCLIVLFTLPALSPQAARAVASEQKIAQEFQAGQYEQVVSDSQAALAGNPKNVSLHYYRANALMHIKRSLEALTEFKLTKSLTRDREITAFCDAAIKSLSDQAEKPDLEGERHSPASQDTQLTKALKNIKQQTDAQTARLLQESRPTRWPSGYYRNPFRSGNQNDSRRSTERATLVEESAANLEEQLATPVGKHSKIFLQPIGTNLYVRNYQFAEDDQDQIEEEPLPVVPLRAQAGLLKRSKIKSKFLSQIHSGK